MPENAYHFDLGEIVRLKADSKNELGRGHITERFYGIDGETYWVQFFHQGTPFLSTCNWFELETAEIHSPEFQAAGELLLLKSGG
jgi:hypothetical protein